jgi:hypothetical protein
MAPTRSKKRKSTESTSSVDVQSFPAPPRLIPTKTRTPARSPTSRSPIKKPTMGITLGQKQALIDNLQLESKDISKIWNQVQSIANYLGVQLQNVLESFAHNICSKHKDYGRVLKFE